MIKSWISLKHIILQRIMNNELFYAGGVVVTNRLAVKMEKAAGRKEPM